MSVPKLRFKEFDGDWIKSKLGSEAQFFQGEQVSLDDQCSEYAHGLIKFLRIENFTQKSKDFRYIRYTGSQEKILVEQDIAIVRYGATAGFICSGETGVIANNLFKVSVDNKKINQKYLELVLKSEKTFNYFQAEMSGGAMPALNFKIVGNLDITYSSIPEQTKIASFLSNVDEKISQLTQKHELLSQYKQGMMQKLFSQQIRFKADDGSEFGEWENTVLGDIADIVGGGTPSTNNEEYWSGDVVWLTPSEINQKFIGESKRTISELGVQKSSAKKLPIGTILFTSRATIGEVAIAIAEVTTNQGFQSFISNEITFNEFLYYWIVNNKKSFIERASGSTFLEISKSKIQPMEISLPCLEEQTKIANFLSAIDQKIEVVAQQIEQAKIWKKGLLQQMFV